MSEPANQEPIHSLIQLILHADGRHISSATPMIDGPAVTGLLTILHDRGYSEKLARHALEMYGVDEAFEALASIADELEKAFEAEPARECDQCGKVEPASGFLDWINGMCEVCDPSILEHPTNVERLQGGNA